MFYDFKFILRALMLIFLICSSVMGQKSAEYKIYGADSLKNGSIIRIKTAEGTLYQGYFLKWHPEYIKIKVGTLDTMIMRKDIYLVWVRERATWTGAKVGAVAGFFIGGIANMLLLGAIHGLCEYDCGEYGTGAKIAAFGIGASAGVVLFGGVGALVGSAFPRWTKKFETGVRERASYNGLSIDLNDKSGEIGEFQMSLNYMRSYKTYATQGGIVGFDFRLFTLLTPYSSTGPEFGHFNPGELSDKNPDYEDKRIKLYGWVYRYEYPIHSFVPFLTTGIGVYEWKEAFWGFSYSAGIRKYFNESPVSFLVEGRIHKGMGRDTEKQFYTIQLGLSWRW